MRTVTKMILNLISLICLLEKGFSQCEDDPLVGWEVKNPMFNGTTSYYMRNLGESITLRCEICNLQINFWIKQWVKIDFGGQLNRIINVTSNADQSEDRIQTNEQGDLFINKIQGTDAGFYICRAIYYRSMPIDSKTVHLIDIVLPLSNETKEITIDMIEEIGKVTETERCDFEAKFDLKYFGCTYEWSIWSPCNTCGKPGVQFRTSECRVVYFLQLEGKNEEGQKVTASMPLYLMSCFSSMIHENVKVKPEIKSYFKTLPVFKAYQECLEECVAMVEGESKPISKHKLSFFKRYRERLREIMRKFKQGVQDIKEGKYETEKISLKTNIPGSTIAMTSTEIAIKKIETEKWSFFDTSSPASHLLLVYTLSMVIFLLIIILKYGRSFSKRHRRGDIDERAWLRDDELKMPTKIDQNSE